MENEQISHINQIRMMTAMCGAYLCDSGRGNMPEHVSYPGQIGPRKLWDILSFDHRMNSSFGVTSSTEPTFVQPLYQVKRREADDNLVILLTFICPAY